MALNLGLSMLVAPAVLVTALAAGCTNEEQVANQLYGEKVTSTSQLKSLADNAFSDDPLTDWAWFDASSSIRKAGITRKNLFSVGKNAFLNAQFTKLDLPNLVYIGEDAFSSNTKLTSLRLPNAREIQYGAFADRALTEVYLPRVRKAPVFSKIVNDKSTVVTLPSQANNPESIAYLFTSRDGKATVAPHDKITFVWVDETKDALGSIEDELKFTIIDKDAFIGQALTDEAWDEPNGLIVKAGHTRDSVVTIGPDAFRGAKFTKLSLSAVTAIYSSAFISNTELTSINFPHLNRTSSYAFSTSPLTTIFAPKLFVIGNESFRSAVNASTTKITLPVVHNSPTALDYMFSWRKGPTGVLAYDKITFVWVDDNGNELPDVKTDLTPLPDTAPAN